MLSERFEGVLGLASRFATQGNEAMLERQQELKLAQSEVSTWLAEAGPFAVELRMKSGGRQSQFAPVPWVVPKDVEGTRRRLRTATPHVGRGSVGRWRLQMRLGGVATRSPHYVASTTARRAVGRRFGVVVGLLACSGRLLLDQKTARLGFNAAAGSPLVLVGSGRHAHNDALAVGAAALDALARDVPIGVLQLYERALAVKRNLLVTEPGSISTAASEAPGATDEDLLRYFKPKSDSVTSLILKVASFERRDGMNGS